MKRMPKQRAGTYHDALTTLKSESRTKFISSDNWYVPVVSIGFAE
jgi:hypothetical protein